MPRIQRWTRFGLIAVTGLAALFVTSQVAQLVELALLVHPAFGAIVAVALLGAIAWLVLVPLAAYLRLAPALIPPEPGDADGRREFVATYLDHCRRNPLLEGDPLTTEEDLAQALRKLSTEAERIANRHASRVFIGTAVSQWGSLDAIAVLVIQLRMVWQIAHVYQQRPSLRQMTYLYANVLATSFLASRLDDVDVSEFLRPVLASVLGQSIASVPGVTAVSAQISNALFQGSVNSFLTLRIAVVAIGYSRSLERPDRGILFRSALARAGHLVFRTATAGAAKVVSAFGVAAAKSAGSAISGAGAATVGGMQSVGRGVSTAGRAVGSTVSLSAKRAHSGATAAASSTRDRVSQFGARTSEGAGSAVRSVGEGVRQFGERIRRRRGNAGHNDSEDDSDEVEGREDAPLDPSRGDPDDRS